MPWSLRLRVLILNIRYCGSLPVRFYLLAARITFAAADLPSLPAVVPALQLLFQDSNEEEVADAARLAMDEGADLAAGEF